MRWTGFTLAVGAFVASHYLPTRGGLERLIGAVGRRAYFAAYGLISLTVLAWVIAAAGRAPYVELWPSIPWTRWIPNVAMPVAAVLAAAGIGISNPFTLGGRRGVEFDPQRPRSRCGRRRTSCRMETSPTSLPLECSWRSRRCRSSIAARAARSDLTRRARSSRALRLCRSPHPGWRRANVGGLARRAAIGLTIWLATLLLHSRVIGVSPLPLSV